VNRQAIKMEGHMTRNMLAAVALIVAGSLAGCGGSGSTTSSGVTAGGTTTAVAGKVADGYLVGATVFLDKNGNYQLDAGEPSAQTDANGAYTLNLDPADVGQYPIVVLAIQGVTTDSDTPGQTLLHSYILSLPKDSVSGTVSNFISPMSTQVREMMGTGQYSMLQAMDEMRTRLGLPVQADIMADYMSNRNDATFQAMHDAARNMAGLMGSQMGQVMSGSGANPSVDVNRYRGMMGTIFSNMSSLRGTGAGAQTAMTTLTGTMMTNLPTIAPGQPYRNMSSAFKGGMMGTRNGGMMGR
jgi:hypothetical protein